MSVESKTIKFKDLDFNLLRKGESYVFSFDDGTTLDLSRFFKTSLTKFNEMSEEEFNNSEGLGVILAGEVDCLVHIGSEYNIKKIDGKTGWEHWIEYISEEELNKLNLVVAAWENEYCNVKIDPSELSDSEKKAIETYIVSKFRSGRLKSY